MVRTFLKVYMELGSGIVPVSSWGSGKPPVARVCLLLEALAKKKVQVVFRSPPRALKGHFFLRRSLRDER
jgi:hypothetical protein